MAKSKMFCVAVEGATASDGRTIERNWIQEMAAGYAPATYGARVNMEHIRGYDPKSPFRAYGDVLALEAREVELSINGKPEKKLGLFAQIDPTDDLVQLTKQRQKIYTSIEVAPNFASTGKAGLVGLAVTDSPASLGTQALTFSAKADDAEAAEVKAGLDARKQDKANLFSAAYATTIELEAEAQPTMKDQLKSFFSEILSAGGQAQPVTQPESKPLAGDDKAFAAVQGLIEKFGDKVAGAVDTLAAEVRQNRQDFDTLKTKLEATDADPSGVRPHASGGAAARWENTDF